VYYYFKEESTTSKANLAYDVDNDGGFDENPLAGEKRLFAPFYTKMIILPRQAPDKHRENSKRDAFSYR
jgi:hypothetical protein